MIFYSLYYFPFSQPFFHPFVLFCFFPPHFVLPYPCTPSFISSSSFSTALILSPTLNVVFFFFLLDSSALILSLLLLLFLLDSSAFILWFFFSLAPSLWFFFFFYLIPEQGIMVKVLWEHFLSRLFLPKSGGWNLWAQERKFSPEFSSLPIFLSLSNSGKHCFPQHFPSYVFHPP